VLNLLSLNCCGLKSKLNYPEFDDELSVGIGCIKLSYSSLKPNTIPPDFLFEKHLRFFIFIKNHGKTISSKWSVFDSTKQRISNVLTNSSNSG
jgi:hypothetical protein